MNQRTFREAVDAAHDFIRAAKEIHDQDRAFWAGSPETAKLRRRSMDLTRALAQMRKPN